MGIGAFTWRRVICHDRFGDGPSGMICSVNVLTYDQQSILAVHLSFDQVLCQRGSGGFPRCRAVMVVANHWQVCRQFYSLWFCALLVNMGLKPHKWLHCFMRWFSGNHWYYDEYSNKPLSFWVFMFRFWMPDHMQKTSWNIRVGQMATLHQLQRSKYSIDHNSKSDLLQPLVAPKWLLSLELLPLKWM